MALLGTDMVFERDEATGKMKVVNLSNCVAPEGI